MVACQAPDTENQDSGCMRVVMRYKRFIMVKYDPIESLDAVEYRYEISIRLKLLNLVATQKIS